MGLVDVGHRQAARHVVMAELVYVKSSWSRHECVEVAQLPGGAVSVRNSRAPARTLTFTRGEWVAFLAGVNTGEFDKQLGA